MLKKGCVTAIMILYAIQAQAGDNHLKILLDGVSEIAAPGVPGPLCVFGEKAFAVVMAGKKNSQEPVVAGCEYKKGRVVAFGHGGYLGAETLKTADTGRLMLNAIKWTAQTPTSVGRKIGVYKNKGLTKFLTEKGMDVKNVDLEQLKMIDLLVADAMHVPEKHIDQVADFVAGGKGLITAALGWGWKQLNPGKSLPEDCNANKLLAEMGIVWADGYSNRTSDAGYKVGEILPSHLTNASNALKAVISEGDFADAQIDQISTILTKE